MAITVLLISGINFKLNHMMNGSSIVLNCAHLAPSLDTHSSFLSTKSKQKYRTLYVDQLKAGHAEVKVWDRG
jgi:hypothetical protein